MLFLWNFYSSKNPKNMSSKSAYDNDFWRITGHWRNAALITGINHILQDITIENSYFKLVFFCIIDQTNAILVSIKDFKPHILNCCWRFFAKN